MKYIPSLVLLFFLYGCSVGKLSRVQVMKIESGVKDALRETFSDIRKYGFIGELSHLDSSSSFFWVPPGKSNPIGIDSIAAILKMATPMYKEVVSIWDTILVSPLQKRVAGYTGRFHSMYTDLQGKISTYSMMETGVAIKRKNKWLLINGQTTQLPKK